MKKFIPAFLTAIMILSMLSVSFVSASAATYTESESNDSYSTADSISVGNSVKGTIGKSLDKDYYKITVSSYGKLAITFKHSYNSSGDSWKVKIYYYSGGTYNELSSNNIALNGSETVALPSVGAVANGVYYILVDTIYTDTIGCDYTIATSFSSTNYREREMNNSFQTATVMSSGNTYSGCLSKSGDKDYYKITATSSGTINFSFNHSYGSSGDRWNVKIYHYSSGSYNELSTNSISINGSETVALPAVGVVANGVYYVLVDTIYTDTLGYEYSITVKSSTNSSYPSLSLSQTSVSISKDETATVTCSYSGSNSNGVKMSYSITDDSIVSASWGSWNNKKVPITFKGLKGGTTTVKISLKDSKTDEVLDYEYITVSVTDNTAGTDNGGNSGNVNSQSGFFLLNWIMEFISLIISLLSFLA